LSNRYSLHSLRHTAVLLRYRAGEKIHSIQRLLGHRSLATTDIYLQGWQASMIRGRSSSSSDLAGS